MKTIIIALAAVFMLVGCGASMTEDNPFGISDPNQVQVWINAAVAAGQTSQAIGVATGNPAMIGYGAVLVVLGGWITRNILMKGKKDGEP